MIIYTTQRVKSSLDGSEHQQIGVCYPIGLLICFMRVNGSYKEFLLNRAGKKWAGGWQIANVTIL